MPPSKSKTADDYSVKTVAVRLDNDLFSRLEGYRRAQTAIPSSSTVLRAALEEFLSRHAPQQTLPLAGSARK